MGAYTASDKCPLKYGGQAIETMLVLYVSPALSKLKFFAAAKSKVPYLIFESVSGIPLILFINLVNGIMSIRSLNYQRPNYFIVHYKMEDPTSGLNSKTWMESFSYVFTGAC